MAPKAPKEPNKHQLSSRLSYQQNTPSFLLKLQNRMAGRPNGEYGDDEDEPQYYEEDGTEYYDDNSGRPPVPQRPRDERPAIPERPDDDPGSADEDDGDEKPQVVVLRKGKHLTEWEAGNVRRKEKGLPPLPDPDIHHPTPVEAGTDQGESATQSKKPKVKEPSSGLSFSTSGAKASSSKKRKVIDTDPDFESLRESVSGKQKSGGSAETSKKKPKKEKKTLLSFGDDA